jgi:hydrogenase-4 component B
MIGTVVGVILGLPLLALPVLFAPRAPIMRHLVHVSCLAISLFLAGSGIFHVLRGGEGAQAFLTLPIGLPWLEAHFRLDALAAFFLVVINLGAAAASLFAIGYVEHLPHPARVVPLFPLFICGMNLVLLADDAFVFLVSWEFMSGASWLLVLADHEEEENRHAAYVYIIMAAFGTLCLLPAFGVMAGAAGDYAFSSMRTVKLPEWQTILVAVLILFGAGSKAGLVPLHAWLPLAHPAAPSHISAMMSGVMTKVAIFALIRVLFDLLRAVPWWWGTVLMVLGAITAVVGILYAMMQTDIKKLLAYSTVENIGLIVIAIGLALAFKGGELYSLAALALIAALYHCLNHAVFKSLLFMGAGAVIGATGERNIEKLGGLIHRMPLTATAFLIGAASIAALPPLNGFVSEWLILQSLFKGPAMPQWAMKFSAPVVGALMALSAALAAACFVRLFGVVFLGRPRSMVAATAIDVDQAQRAALLILAGICILLGILPVMMSTMLANVAQSLTSVVLQTSAEQGWPWLTPVSEVRGSYSGTVLVVSLLILSFTTLGLIRLFGTTALRRADAWDCGHVEDNPASQYSASSFAQPFRRVYGSTVFAAREEVDMPTPDEARPARFELHMIDPIWKWLYVPIWRSVTWITEHFNQLQTVTVRRYLLLMFITLVAMLILVAARRV